MSDKQLDDLKLHGIRNRQRYLNYNDWYCCRLTRTTAAGEPVPIPTDILTKMQLASDEIGLIADATDFSEVNTITIEFE